MHASEVTGLPRILTDTFIEFGVDIAATQVNILTTLSVGTLTATMDIELVAGP